MQAVHVLGNALPLFLSRFLRIFTSSACAYAVLHACLVHSHMLPHQALSSAPTTMHRFHCVLPAGTGEQLAKYCWLPARMLLCCKSDVELRAHLIEAVMRDGLLGPQAAPAAAAAAWVQLWLNANHMDRETLMMMLAMRARLQVRAADSSGKANLA
jgi:hypothetical protein